MRYIKFLPLALISFISILPTGTANAFIWSPTLTCENYDLFPELAFLNEDYLVSKNKISLSYALKNYSDLQSGTSPVFGNGRKEDLDLAKSNVHLGIYTKSIVLSIINGGSLHDYSPYTFDEYQASYIVNLSSPIQPTVFEVINRYMYGKYTSIYGIRIGSAEMVKQAIQELKSAAELAESLFVNENEQYYKWISVAARLDAINALFWNGSTNVHKYIAETEKAINGSFLYDYMHGNSSRVVKEQLDKKNRILRENSLFLLDILRLVSNSTPNKIYATSIQGHIDKWKDNKGSSPCYSHYIFWGRLALSKYYLDIKEIDRSKNEINLALSMVNPTEQPHIYNMIKEKYLGIGFRSRGLYFY